MKYFRVKKEYDNKFIGSRALVQNELYTEKEVERRNIPRSYLDEVEVKRTETYWSFGARFSLGCGFLD